MGASSPEDSALVILTSLATPLAPVGPLRRGDLGRDRAGHPRKAVLGGHLRPYARSRRAVDGPAALRVLRRISHRRVHAATGSRARFRYGQTRALARTAPDARRQTYVYNVTRPPRDTVPFRGRRDGTSFCRPLPRPTRFCLLSTAPCRPVTGQKRQRRRDGRGQGGGGGDRNAPPRERSRVHNR